jgi:hypothetical protein
MQPETPYARSGKVHIAYRVFGDRAVDLVFVPGFISTIKHSFTHPLLEGVN